MKISSNITAMMTVGHMNNANTKAAQTMQRLSSGLKINSAKDNPAGMAIARKLSAQVKGLNQAKDNAMNGISMIQTAEGAMNEVHAMLNRMRELTVQGLNDSVNEADRQHIQDEINQLTEEIKQIQTNTEFNKIPILSSDEDIMIQTGANTSQAMQISGKDINLNQTIDLIEDLSFEKEFDPLHKVDPDYKGMLTSVDEAIAQTSTIRGKLGAYQNRLEHTVTNLGVSEENMTASLSTIEDADMAEEMTTYTQYNVIAQAGIAMLAQANQRPQQVLQLLNT